MDITADEIVSFWFEENNKKMWFNSTPQFDQLLTDKFQPLFESAAAGELDHWKDSSEGALALCIILDQFPLNMYRGQAKSFSTEAAARAVSAHALDSGFDKALNSEQRLFLFLPFMHSENLEDQDRSVSLFTKAGMDTRYPEHHRGIIKRFGRFPHRNQALGRESTREEEDYLNSDEAFHG